MRNSTVKRKSIGSQKRGSPSAGEIYREAARILERSSGIGFAPQFAIEEANGTLGTGTWCKATKQFYLDILGSQILGGVADLHLALSQDEGVVGLCFMAAIADSEE